ncbi:MAG: TRAM domain-containing protein [Spirochaetales bacterium]|jgi:23S rRNA (uracil1939-C5)-methyltransferase|nr:TRAM domain-containing protein [Spirochaetales bacterium]
MTDSSRHPRADALIQVEKIASGGAGLGRLNGKVVFIPYTLPGETVRVQIVREKKDYARAQVLEIIKASPLRREPECPLFGLCGGCDFQHTDYEEQKNIKLRMVQETFKRIGRVEPGEILFEQSAPFGCRSRVQLHRTPDGELPWGFKKAASDECVPVRHCPAAVPEINDFLAGEAGKAAGRDFHGGSDGSSGSGGGRIHVFGSGGRTAFRKDDEIRLTLCGKDIVFSPECFFQSNIPLLEKLIGRAFNGLSGSRALDIYGGVGTFAAFLEDRFRNVISIEENPLSSSYARRNLNPDTTRVFTGSVEDWIAGSADAQTPPDLIVADPPRAGLSGAVRAFLKKTGSPLILYVSCDAGTLARDSAFLLENGYTLDQYRLFDFYPQTAHVESLCRFTRN